MTAEVSDDVKQIHRNCDKARASLDRLEELVEDLRLKPYNAKEIEYETAQFLRCINQVRVIQESRDNTIVA